MQQVDDLVGQVLDRLKGLEAQLGAVHQDISRMNEGLRVIYDLAKCTHEQVQKNEDSDVKKNEDSDACAS